jgi:hypothetical protein
MRAISRMTRAVRLAMWLVVGAIVGAGALGAQEKADSSKASAFGALKGVVQGPDGKAVSGVDVVVNGTALRVKSRGDGSFLLQGIPPGDYEVLFRKLGYDPASFTTTVVAGQQQEVQVKLAPLVRTLDTVNVVASVFNEITGFVTDTSGRPLDGADVEIDGTEHRMRTRADGRFLFLDVAPGRYLLRVRKMGYSQVRRSLEMAKQLERTVGIQLTPLPYTLSPMEIIAQSGLSAADTVAQIEYSIRRRMAGVQSDVLTREDVAEMGKSPLDVAITQKSRGIAAKALASAACVLVDGQQPLVDAGQGVQLGMAGRGASFGGGGGNSNPAMRGAAGAAEFRILQTITSDMVESVELYPAGSEMSSTACGRFPLSMPACNCDAARSPAIVVVWIRK